MTPICRVVQVSGNVKILAATASENVMTSYK